MRIIKSRKYNLISHVHLQVDPRRFMQAKCPPLYCINKWTHYRQCPHFPHCRVLYMNICSCWVGMLWWRRPTYWFRCLWKLSGKFSNKWWKSRATIIQARKEVQKERKRKQKSNKRKVENGIWKIRSVNHQAVTYICGIW